jgi:hypothetical protein
MTKMNDQIAVVAFFDGCEGLPVVCALSNRLAMGEGNSSLLLNSNCGGRLS